MWEGDTRFVAGTARLLMAHGLVRLSWSEGSPAGLAPTRAGCGMPDRTVCRLWWEPTLLAIADGAGKPLAAQPQVTSVLGRAGGWPRRGYPPALASQHEREREAEGEQANREAEGEPEECKAGDKPGGRISKTAQSRPPRIPAPIREIYVHFRCPRRGCVL